MDFGEFSRLHFLIIFGLLISFAVMALLVYDRLQWAKALREIRRLPET
jgi:hypothetical protein